MTTADLTRRVESGGAFGYYDGWPTGTIIVGGITLGTASFVSGLHNTYQFTRSLASGSTVELLFGQQSSNPLITPLPRLFDVNVSFSGSIDIYDVDVAGLTLTSEALTINIGPETFTYSRGNLNTLFDNLVNKQVPPEIAQDFVDVVAEAMDATGQIEDWAFEFFNSFTTADFSGMQGAVNVVLASGMAVSPENGTPVNIGQMAHVNGTGFDDEITGSDAANIINAGGGDDTVLGSLGVDGIYGGAGDDAIRFTELTTRLPLAVQFRLSDVAGSPIWHTGVATTGNPADPASFVNVSTLYDIDTVLLGIHSDIAFIDAISERAAAAGLVIDGGSNINPTPLEIQAYAGLPVHALDDAGDTVSLENYAVPAGDTVYVDLDLADPENLPYNGLMTHNGRSVALLNFESVLGSAAKDQLLGSGATNYLLGLNGDDTLIGRGGADGLVGDAGADRLYGGTWTGLDVDEQGAPLGTAPTDCRNDRVADYLHVGELVSVVEIFLANTTIAGQRALAY